MRRRYLACLTLAAAASLVARGAYADPDDTARWFDGPARKLSLARSAARDAPVLEYAYGPRAQATLGTEIGLMRWGSPGKETRLGLSALIAMENPDASEVVPSFVAVRDVEQLSLASTLPLHDDAFVETSVALGHESAHARRESARVDPYRVTDIPFGGGGYFLSLDAALFQLATPKLELTTRIGDRIFTNAFPAWVGQREASNHTADFLDEGLMHSPFAEVTLRYRACHSFHPLVSVFGEAFVAHDDSAKDGGLVRVLGAVALSPGRSEFWPFMSFEAGNGKGLFINRQELRFALGVRHVLW